MNPPYSAQTYQAVLLLLSQGQAPSWRKVREITGTGSSNDLVREIKSVLRELAQRSAAGEYPKPIQDAFWALWNGAKDAAASEFDEQRREADLKVTEALSAQAAAEQKAVNAESRLADANEDIAALHEQLNALRARESALTQQLDQANNRIDAGAGREAALNEQVTQLNQHILDLQLESEQRLKALRSDHETFLADMAVENQKAITRLKDELKAEESRYNRDTARIMKSWDDERVRLLAQIKEAQGEAKATRAEANSLSAQLGAAQADLRIASDGNSTLQRRIAELQSMLTAAETRATDAETRSALLISRLPEPPQPRSEA